MTSVRGELRPGVTLIELVLVIAVIAISLAVVGVAVSPTPSAGPDAQRREIAAMRRAALASGRDTTATLSWNGTAQLVTVLRDGRVLVRDRSSVSERGTEDVDASR